MKTAKRLLAAMLALAASLTIAGCGKADEDSSFESTSNIKVPSADEIAAIPEGSENTLDWCSFYDLNPTVSTKEKSTELTLFEEKGGKINYIQTTSLKANEKLAGLVLADTPPDIFPYSSMTFPANTIAGMFQSVDSIVDFDSAMWSDMKDLASQYMIGDKHYIAPTGFGDSQPVITYDSKLIETEGLDDPYTLYQDGKWDWDSMRSIMEAYVANASSNETRYGINGYYASAVFVSTGQTIVKKDEKTGEYTNNINNADLERAADYLYDLGKDKLIMDDWLGTASNAFENNVLFFSMGYWGATTNNTPKKGDTWMSVPFPKDPKSDTYYRQLDISRNAYMWVKGSTKSDAVKCWYECSKIAKTNENYKKTEEDKFFEINPYWTKEAYDIVTKEIFDTDKFTLIFNPGDAITAELSDDAAATNDKKEAIISYIYGAVVREDEDTGIQNTWSQLREQYTAKIDSELKTFNTALKKFEKENAS